MSMSLRSGLAQSVGAGRRRERGDPRRVRVVAIDARQPLRRTLGEIPVTVRPAVRTGLPVTIRWAVAAPAQRYGIVEFQLAAVTHLQREKVRLIVAVVTEVVPIVRTVAHLDVRVFLGDDNLVVRV